MKSLRLWKFTATHFIINGLSAAAVELFSFHLYISLFLLV